MRKLNEIAGDVKAALEGSFSTVVVTAAQNDQQIHRSLEGCGKHQFPAAVVTFNGGAFVAENTLLELKLSIVCVDLFGAGEAASALRGFGNIDCLIETFPPGGKVINGVFYLPGVIKAASADPAYVSYAIELTAKQG